MYLYPPLQAMLINTNTCHPFPQDTALKIIFSGELSKKNYCKILDRNYFTPKRETAFFWILTESYAIWYLTHNIYFQLPSIFFPAKCGNIESGTIPPPSF